MNMRIGFITGSVSREKRERIIAGIERDREKLEEFFITNELVPEVDPFEFEILFHDPVFGVLTEGFMDRERKEIHFYGVEESNLIIHEWIHAAFPNDDNERHSEGFAIYIQMQLGSFHYFGFDKPLDLVLAFLHARNREGVTNWFQYIMDEQNFYDSRWGRMLMSRALSGEFVSWLINKYGINEYMERYYRVIRDNKSFYESEEEDFYLFFNSLPKSSKLSMEPFFDLKATFIDTYSKHFLPKKGSVLNYLVKNREIIDQDKYSRLQNAAIEDLRTTIMFYKY